MPATDPIKTDTNNGQHTAVYADTVNSLKTLELSFERDESNWLADIKSVETGTDDGAPVTVATYQDVPNFKMGHLTVVSYSTDEDRDKLKKLHDQAGETFLFTGTAFVVGNELKIIVFREK